MVEVVGGLGKQLSEKEVTELYNDETKIPTIHYQLKNDLIIDTEGCSQFGVEGTEILLGLLVKKQPFFPYATVRWEDSGTSLSMQKFLIKLGFQASGNHYSLPLEHLKGKNLDIEVLPYPLEKFCKRLSMFWIAFVSFYVMKSFLPELSQPIQ